MYQSRLVQHIRELPAKKRERFRQFINSPYFNQHDRTTALLEFILKKLDGRPSGLSKERAYKALFPGEDFNEQQLYNVMSYLNKLYYRFMAAEYTEKQRYLESVFTLEEAFENHQFDIMTNRGKQLMKKLKKDPVRPTPTWISSIISSAPTSFARRPRSSIQFLSATLTPPSA